MVDPGRYPAPIEELKKIDIRLHLNGYFDLLLIRNSLQHIIYLLQPGCKLKLMGLL